ncbi:GPI ethanolamine phosphate transferase 3 [Melia azedarach]|uniref:GPI ethanolamine phosphate transferase 3 n=1 Tax=Melia azedarach TaxID=155640 RepID=A0ACC1YGS9_MELAZ|nr:GPI ethanolamine phosphate transferase 3 [Melia azedarach]
MLWLFFGILGWRNLPLSKTLRSRYSKNLTLFILQAKLGKHRLLFLLPSSSPCLSVFSLSSCLILLTICIKDHAGHINGIDSISMVEKLEQYNAILEKVIEKLHSQSGPGGLHENTFLLVMGDHGQTINGDHGGGSAEEVETSIFAMSFKKPPSSIPSEFDTSYCETDLDQKKTCISSIQQLDFAVTVSALLGVPFPFGSIGRVSPELYALGAGTWNLESANVGHWPNQKEEEWMRNYCNVLCINSWQVKRYIDIYSASSVIGFSSEDLLNISNIYAQAEGNSTCSSDNKSLHEDESYNSSLPTLKRKIDTYFNFLLSVAELARSKWTEFNLEMMGIGFGIMLISLSIHFYAIRTAKNAAGIPLPLCADSQISVKLMFAVFIVVIHACSLLSNSYILEEGKVANFLLATTAMFKLHYSIKREKMLMEAIFFLLLITILRFAIEIGLSKQAATSLFMSTHASWMVDIDPDNPMWIYMAEIIPILALILLAYLLYITVTSSSCCGIWKYVISGTILCYILIAVHWASESDTLSSITRLQGIGRNCIPKIIYAVGLGQLLLLAFSHLFHKDRALDSKKHFVSKTVAMLSTCSSTIIILSGKQGSLIALASIAGGYCIMRLGNIEQDINDKVAGILTFDPLSVTQWSLLATCLFFSTGHWCAFDGLRYGAAFIGFDEFILVRQALLLTIDTFGFSHIIPVFGLPFLVADQQLLGQTDQDRRLIIMQLYLMYLMYGLTIVATVVATIICVTIQRRHLMVWGLFAPKFVFDVVGLILADILICLAWLYFVGRGKDGGSGSMPDRHD